MSDSVWKQADQMLNALWVGITGLGSGTDYQRAKWFADHLHKAQAAALRDAADELERNGPDVGCEADWLRSRAAELERTTQPGVDSHEEP
jgi:hypothetical protein